MAGDITAEFDDAFYEWLHLPAESRAGGAAERRVIELLGDAWKSGERETRHDVMYVVGSAARVEFADLVWESLESGDSSLIAAGLAATLSLVRRDRSLLTDRIVAILRGLVTEGPGNNPWFALHVLGMMQTERLHPWLRELAVDHPDEDVRHEANRILLPTGYQPAKQALFEDVRRNRDHGAVAIDLWAYRAVLRLTQDEVRELEEMLHVYVAKVCDMMQDTESANRPPVKVVGALARDGLELRAGVIDEIAAYACAAPEAKYRLEAVDALAAIGKPRARELLEELAGAGEPADAAEQARQLLRGDGA